jgi:glyoxylase-like metal-dependent hydrolase (beta-lactamase superfamily II)
MAVIETIPLPLAHVGSVNAWLVRGRPLTLIDTGPRTEQALEALEQGLNARGVRVEDIELVIGTHHHHDHVGLAATIKRRSGARTAVIAAAADYTADYERGVARDRQYATELMRAHGAPDDLLASADALWGYIARTSESFEADVRLADGDRIRAGDRQLDVIARPGHSATDTLLVDRRERVAFVGDHLLAKISPNTEIYEVYGVGESGSRSRSRVTYLHGLKRTATMPVESFLPGHGPPVLAAPAVVRRQLAQHRRRCGRIARILARGPVSAFEVGRQMWSDAVVREQPLLVLWEVLGHLDLMLAAGIATEQHDEDGHVRFALRSRRPRAAHANRGEALVDAG